MAVVLADLLTDLAVETAVLDDILTGLNTADWERPTPAEGWAIRDQISHLAYFDEAAAQAIQNPEAFRTGANELAAFGPAFPDVVAERYRDMPAARLLDWFRTERNRLITTVASLDPKTRVPWYGPDMSIASSVTARMMETWAHGQDVADTVGICREPTARLRHIAHLAVSTFSFSYRINDRPVPDKPVYVELTAPEGGMWTWGDPSSVNQISGPALDFCLAATQRRHTADTVLRIEGPVAAEWMSIAQTFAGAPGTGRKPGQFARDATAKEAGT